MASPTFNGAKLFDSKKADGTPFSEGVLFCPEYSKITQILHFSGEDGNRRIEMGWPDRPWTFKGLISASSLVLLKNILTAIEAQVDDGTYQTLVDSFGNVYPLAQIVHLLITNIHKSDDGYVASIQVEGIIQGMTQDGGT